MRSILKQIKIYISGLLMLDRMDERFKLLTINYLFLMIYYTIEMVFVNTLLYRLSNNQMLFVFYYRAITYVFAAIAMNVTAVITKKHSPVVAIKFGTMFYILLYIILLIWMDDLMSFWFLAAAISGVGGGVYWVGHTVLMTRYTNKHNRATGVSIQGIVQGIMTLCVPLVSGFVISFMPGNSGYRVMFGIGMLAAILQRTKQKQLPGLPPAKHVGAYSLAFKLVWRKLSLKLMLGYEFIRGFRDGTFGFFLNMLLFKAISDEGLIGVNTFLTGAASIIGSWAYGRLSTANRRIKLALGSVSILSLSCVFLIYFLNPPLLVGFSVINAFLTVFFIYAGFTSSFDVLGQNETTRQCLTELTGLREIALSLGRLLGLVVLMLFPQDFKGYLTAMLLLTASQYFGVLIIKIIKDIFERKQNKTLQAPTID